MIARSSTAGRSHARFLLATLMCCAQLGFVASVHAQGLPVLPGPMTTHELMEYLDRLSLTVEQREAVLTIHDQYLEEFKALAEDLGQFRRDVQTLLGMEIPFRRDEAKDYLNRWDRAMARIRSVDDRLFGRVEAVLDEEQVTRLPEVRWARERDRYRARHVSEYIPWPGVDLRQILSNLELSPAEREATEPVLRNYEHRLTHRMRKLSRACARLLPDFVVAVQALQPGLNDDEAAEELSTVVQNTLAEINKLRDVHERAYKSLAALLSASNARALRDRFYERGYRETLIVTRKLRAEGQFAYALALDEISDEKREWIEAVALETRWQLDRTLEQAVRLVDKFDRNYSPLPIYEEEAQLYMDRLVALGKKAADIDRRAIATLHSILGDELIERHATVLLADGRRGVGRGNVGGAPSGKDAAAGRLAEGVGTDPLSYTLRADAFLPDPIGPRELAMYSWLLGLNAEQRDALRQVHEVYMEQFEQVAGPELNAVRRLQRDVYGYGAVGDVVAADAVDDLMTARRVALDIVRQVDGAFLANLQMIVLAGKEAPGVNHALRCRERDTYHAYIRRYNPLANNASRVDMLWLLYEQTIPEADVTKLDGVLETYDETLTSLVRTRYEHRLEEERAVKRYLAQSARLHIVGATDEEYRELFDRAEAAIAEVTAPVRRDNVMMAELNRRTLAEMVSLLAPERGRVLRDAFSRHAYPTVYRDPTAVSRSIAAALRLSGLTEDQQSALEELAARYEPEYRRLCEQMVQIAAKDADGEAAEGLAYPERPEAAKRLRFERDELNARAILELRSNLTEEQIRRIERLPDPRGSGSGVSH